MPSSRSKEALSPKKEAIRVTLIGMYLDVVLGGAKLVGGALLSSYALIADGIHSLSDAGTDIFVLIVARYSHEAPDSEHPYGHGRFEAIGTVVLGMVLFAIAGILLFDSLQRLNEENLPVPAWGGLIVAAISIASKEWIYHYTMRTANKLNSSLLRANAWHSRTDAISSIAVLLGLFGAQQGYPWLDVVAAMFVALIIARIGFQLSLDSLKELVDTAIPATRQKELERCILTIPGIHQVHSLRSRQSGGKVLLEAQVLVDPRISVSEGHQLGEAARRTLSKRFTDINDVIIHIDPEPHDPTVELPQTPPLRDEILGAIRERWQEIIRSEDIENINFHYLNNRVEVDLQLSSELQAAAVAKSLAEALRPLDYVSRLTIYQPVFDTVISTDFDRETS